MLGILGAAASVVHGAGPPTDAFSMGLLALLGGGYAIGAGTLWRRAGRGRGVRRANVAAYYAGLLVIGVAIMGPVDHAADEIFAAHMIQHVLLILVAAPLLVAGVPEVALAWALPARLRRWTKPLARVRGGSTRGGLLVLLVATATLWVWHAPALYDAAVADTKLHAIEHASFLATAWLFWWTVLRLRGSRWRDGVRVLSIFAMAMQGALLGALLTFATRPIYGAHLDSAREWGLSPLQDQQLAGLIMWVPPGLLYTSVAAILLFRWLRALERSRPPHERNTQPTPAAPVPPASTAAALRSVRSVRTARFPPASRSPKAAPFRPRLRPPMRPRLAAPPRNTTSPPPNERAAAEIPMPPSANHAPRPQPLRQSRAPHFSRIRHLKLKLNSRFHY